jgi:hypothetical protein
MIDPSALKTILCVLTYRRWSNVVAIPPRPRIGSTPRRWPTILPGRAADESAPASIKFNVHLRDVIIPLRWRPDLFAVKLSGGTFRVHSGGVSVAQYQAVGLPTPQLPAPTRAILYLLPLLLVTLLPAHVRPQSRQDLVATKVVGLC